MKPKFIFIVIFCLGIFIMMVGCATVGQDFSADAVHDIRIDTTTAGEVLKMLGPPWRTGLENGRKTWTYRYYKYRLFGPTDTRDLIITFNPDNTVAAYSFNTTDTDHY